MRLLSAVALLLAFASVGFVSAAASKVDVCHVTGTGQGEYVVISVADSAYQTHLDHGDVPYVDGACDDGGGPSPT